MRIKKDKAMRWKYDAIEATFVFNGPHSIIVKLLKVLGLSDTLHCKLRAGMMRQPHVVCILEEQS